MSKEPNIRPQPRTSSGWLWSYRYLLYPVLWFVWMVASIRGGKIGRALRERSRWHDSAILKSTAGSHASRIHFHASSVGEFEQAKPIIEELKRRNGSVWISASFSSPSGFDQQKTYQHLDFASYLPLDRPQDIARFLEEISPTMVIVIRYDLWPEYMHQLHTRGVPVILASGVLRANSSRFLPIVRSFSRNLYGQLDAICCVGTADEQPFQRLVPDVHTTVCGDTRYDRVLERKNGDSLLTLQRDFISDRFVLVAGSTWGPDELLLAAIDLPPGALLIIVPHEPTPEHIQHVKSLFPRSRTLGDLEQAESTATNCIIADRTGVLFDLYRVATVAYVGGGFGEGVHSVLEPAAFGVPVICGPRTSRSRDAEALAVAGLLTRVNDATELQAGIDAMTNAIARSVRSEATAAFVIAGSGATRKTLDVMNQFLSIDFDSDGPSSTRPS